MTHIVILINKLSSYSKNSVASEVGLYLMKTIKVTLGWMTLSCRQVSRTSLGFQLTHHDVSLGRFDDRE